MIWWEAKISMYYEIRWHGRSSQITEIGVTWPCEAVQGEADMNWILKQVG